MTGKVLIVSRQFWPEKIKINEVCDYLTSRDMKVDVLCGQPSMDNGEFFRKYNSFRIRREVHNKAEIFRAVDVKRGSGSNISIFINYVFFPISSSLLIKQLMKRGYNSVFIFQKNPVMMSRAGIRLAKKAGIPVYIYVDELWPQSLSRVIEVRSSLFKKFLYKMSMNYYSKADRLIVPTAKMKKYFADNLGMTDDRLPVIPLFPDAEYETEIVDNDLLEKTAGGFNILIAVDPDVIIAADTIAKAADRLRGNRMTGIRFTVTGNGDSVRKLRELTDKMSLNDMFFFEGKTEPADTGKYLHAADALLGAVPGEMIDEYNYPPQFINFLAAGKPLVLSLGGMVRDLVKRSGCGYSSEPEDAAGLFENIARLYRLDPEKRLEMGSRSKELEIMLFNRENALQGIEQIICGEAFEGPETDSSSIKKLSEM